MAVDAGRLRALYPDTRRQEAIIAAADAVLRADDRVLACWLGGSFGQGRADPFSDVDIHGYVADDDLASIESEWSGLVDRIMPTVFTRRLGAAAFGAVGGYAISPEWDHLDLWFYARSQAPERSNFGIVPLFDQAGVLPTTTIPPAPPGDPHFPRELVEGFLYALGNLPVVVGRGELLLMVTAVGMFRDQMLVPLMYAERGIDPKGGLKRFSQHLSEEQIAELFDMPTPGFDLDALIEANVWLARVFLRRARALAAATGADYPVAFEAATIAHVEQTLGIDIGVG